MNGNRSNSPPVALCSVHNIIEFTYVSDVYLDPETRNWVSWRDRVPQVCTLFLLQYCCVVVLHNILIAFQIEFTGDVPMSSVTVPTPETTSISYFMDVLINLGKPSMC